MQEQTITFRWRTFEEETPQSGRDILVKTPASPCTGGHALLSTGGT